MARGTYMVADSSEGDCSSNKRARELLSREAHPGAALQATLSLSSHIHTIRKLSNSLATEPAQAASTQNARRIGIRRRQLAHAQQASFSPRLCLSLASSPRLTEYNNRRLERRRFCLEHGRLLLHLLLPHRGDCILRPLALAAAARPAACTHAHSCHQQRDADIGASPSSSETAAVKPCHVTLQEHSILMRIAGSRIHAYLR